MEKLRFELEGLEVESFEAVEGSVGTGLESFQMGEATEAGATYCSCWSSSCCCGGISAYELQRQED